MASLLVSQGPLFGAQFPLERESLIGRLAAATVQLPSVQVSRRHAKVVRRSNRWHLEDLGSRNGTWINGGRLKGSEVLSPGDNIRVGETSLIFDAGVELLSARYGEAWILIGPGEGGDDYERGAVGSFGGSPRELAALSHLFSATVEEEGLVRGILQLIADRFDAFEVVLLRLGAGVSGPKPLGAVAPSGPIPLNGDLIKRVMAEGRGMGIAQSKRWVMESGRLSFAKGGPALVLPLEVGQGLTGLITLSRRMGEPPFTQGEIARLGAIASFSAPALENARRAHLQRRRHRAWVEPEGGEVSLAGSSPATKVLSNRVREVAAAGGPVLLIGGPGVGKEMVARLIHSWSPRWEGPLVQIPCSTMAEAQLELSLFGRVPMAGEGDLGADRGVIGKAALADGGTIYLDRVEALSPALQDRLVRLCQCGHVWRLGATLPRSIDVRIIASSEVSLVSLVRRGALRPELGRILSAQVVELPELSARLDDIEHLVWALLPRISLRLGRRITRVSDGAYDLLKRRPWPGNLRELEEVLTRAVSYCADSTLSAEDVELGADSTLSPLATGAGGRLSDTLREQERQLMVQALGLGQGRVGEAARALNMTPKEFEQRWRLLGLDEESL